MAVSRLARQIRTVGRFGIEMFRGLPEHARQRDHTAASLPRRVLEQWSLLLSNNITAFDYYLFALHRPDLPWRRKRAFIGEMDWRWLSLFNPHQYRLFTEDKIIFKRHLAHAGIPVPRLIGIVGPAGRAETGEPLRTDEELRAWLADTKVEDVVLKPVQGSRGAGVLVLGERLPGTGQWERMPTGQVSLDEVVAHRHAYPQQPYFMIEERIRPHAELAAFSPSVVHTARIITALDDEVRVLGAALRIGLGQQAVDNFAKGNLVAPIDLETGRLGPAAAKHTNVQRYRTHPVTGAPIDGHLVPDWERALAVTRAAAQAVPFNLLIGWDVALTPSGPLILEANARWDPAVLQLAHDRGLLETPLGTYLERRGAFDVIGLGIGPARPRRSRSAAG